MNNITPNILQEQVDLILSEYKRKEIRIDHVKILINMVYKDYYDFNSNDQSLKFLSQTDQIVKLCEKEN